MTVDAGPQRWAAVAADCGYYASHLIRDFRELGGQTPARIVAGIASTHRCVYPGSTDDGFIQYRRVTSQYASELDQFGQEGRCTTCIGR